MALARSRSIVDCARVQAFTFLLTKTLSRSRSVVWCVVWCVYGVLCFVCACGVLVCGLCVCTCGIVCCWLCVLFCCVGACVCGVKLGTHSLSLSLLLSLHPLLFPFRFPFLFLSYLYFYLFFFFFFLSFSSLSLLFSSPNTMERTDQPTRRPTSRHLNVIWRRASAQQSVLSLLLSPPSSPLQKREGTFYYRNISGEEFSFYYSFKLIPKNRRRMKLQSLQFYINSKTIGL